jgi:hypothetical protein
MSDARTRHMEAWSSRPLCREYVAVVFGQVAIAQATCRQEGLSAFSWALGTLRDGQAEVLGWWQHTESIPTDWSMIWNELYVRGVERIQMVIGNFDAASDVPGAGNTTVPQESCALVAGKPAHAMSPQLLCRIDEASTTAKRIQAALARSVQARFRADGNVAAAELIDNALHRIDRRLWSPVAALRVRSPARRAATAAAR